MTPPAAPVDVVTADPERSGAFLAALEAATGVPPVDEDEHRRLAALPPVRDPGWDWTGHLVLADGRPVAYAGIRTPPAAASAGCAARVDLAFDRTAPDAQAALDAALTHVRTHADRGPRPEGGASGRVEGWLRGATADDLATAARSGFTEHGRLHVLGVDAATVARLASPRPQVPDGLRLRPFDPAAPADERAVVALLARAYDVAPDHHADTFPTLRRAAWFRPEDLLLLERPGDGPAEAPGGTLVALHWMKRRGADVGEVYNLAVDPDAQGHGHGALLLDAGLRHLVSAGSAEVLLWVDARNTRALDLYRSRGFTGRWDDVSLVG